MQQHRNHWQLGAALASVALLLGGSAARAQDSEPARGNMPASSSAGSTSTGGESSQKTPRAAPAPEVAPSVPDRAQPDESGNDPTPGWQMGSQGTVIELEELAPVEVVDLQERLQALKLYPGKVDGIAGPLTRLALQRYFMKQAELAARGQLDASALDLFEVVPASAAVGTP